MNRLKTVPPCWPPFASSLLRAVSKPSGQVVEKDVRSARIYGLSYHIETTPVYDAQRRFCEHHLHIDAWEYSIHNESTEYPVLSFKLRDRGSPHYPKEQYISAIHILSEPLAAHPVLCRRAVRAGLLMIDQIQKGFLPDVERILKVYRLCDFGDGFGGEQCSGAGTGSRKSSAPQSCAAQDDSSHTVWQSIS